MANITDMINQFGLAANITAGGHSVEGSNGVVAPTPKAASLGGFISNVAHSVGHIAGEVPGAVANAFHYIPELGRGIGENLPGGVKAINQKSFQQTMDSINANRSTLQRLYRQKAPQFQGAEGEAYFNKLMGKLSQQAKDASGQHQNDVKGYLSGGQIAKDAALTAATAIPVGEVVSGAKAAVTGAKAAKTAEKPTAGIVQRLLNEPITGRQVASAAINVPARATVANSALSLPQDIKSKNATATAVDAGTLAAPAIIKGAGMLASKAAGAVKNAIFDTSGLFDTVKIAGGQTVNDALKVLQTQADSGAVSQGTFKRAVNALKVAQDNILAETGGNVKLAAKKLETELAATGSRGLENRSLSQFVGDLKEFHAARRTAENNRKFIQVVDRNAPSGSRPLNDGERVGVGRINQSEKAALAKALGEATTTEDRRAVLSEYRNSGILKNKNLRAHVETLATSIDDPKQLANAIRGIRGTNELNVLDPSAGGMRVFRAGSPLSKTKVTDEGISVTPSKKIAQKHFQQFLGRGTIQTHTLSPSASIMPFQDIPKDLYKHLPSGEIHPVGAGNGNYEKIIALARAKGYDAVDLKRFGEGEIRVINPKVLDAAGPKALPNGYHHILLPKAGAAVKRADQVGELIQGHKAPLGAVGKALEKTGLSPVPVDNKEVFTALKENFDTHLPNDGKFADVNKIYNTLRKAARDKNVQDPRLLKLTEVRNALGSNFTRSDARAVQAALRKASADLPASQVGLGGKLLNKTLSIPGAGKAQAQYLRLEQAGRYGRFNYAFTGKQITKGALITTLQGGALRGASADTMKVLEDAGKFSRSHLDQTIGDLLNTDDYHVGGSDINQIVQPLKNMVGGMAETFAKQQGKSVRQIIDEGGPAKDELYHLIDNITGYPKGGYINSPLAKSLNIAIFPSRFDTKVLMAAGKAMAKTNPIAQAGIVNAALHANQWIKSPDGKKWQQNNSELIGLMKYFTPLQTIGEVTHIFEGKGGGVGDLGSIGGLPFGIITTILDHQGVGLGKLAASQYVDPKTGQLVPTNIPQTDKARLQQGMTDLVGSIFSYPGATVGLTSKTKVIQGVVPQLKPGKGETVPMVKQNGKFVPYVKPGTAASASTPGPVAAQRKLTLPTNIMRPDQTYAAQKAAKAKKGKVKYHALPLPPR